MVRRGSMGRIGLALAAGYLLVLEALLGGLATGAHGAARLVLSAPGQVICSGFERGSGPREGDAPADPTHHKPDCCVKGCHFAGALGIPPPSLATLRANVPVARATRWPASDHQAPGALATAYTARGPPHA